MRERNIPSGTSGRVTRFSMTMKRAMSRAAAASRPRVRADVQPASLAPTTAYTARSRLAVMVTAPAMSMRPVAVRGAFGTVASVPT